MLSSRTAIKGRVTWRVLDADGNVKMHPQTVLDKLLKRHRPMMGVNHNIVTNEGDALIADLMAKTPARTKVDGTNGYIEVGTGYTAEAKTVTSCVTPTGSPELMDSTYPKIKGSFGAADDNVTQYRATFEAGDLNATGIDEAALINGATATSADCLAYAQINPAVNVGASDTLQVDWELTFTGS